MLDEKTKMKLGHKRNENEVRFNEKNEHDNCKRKK